MRKLVIAAIATLGIAFVGAPGASAAPASGVLGQLTAGMSSSVQQAHYVRRNGWICYRKCYHEFFNSRRVCRTFC